jgi:prepilin peptidase CpaA
MTIPVAAALAATLCFAATTVWAGVTDLMTMKIRNDLILLLLALYAALAPLAGFGAVEIGTSAAVAFSVLVCMFTFFSMGWVGGGDAKLAAAIALWVGAEHTLTYLLSTAIFGGVLTLMILQFRSMALPAFCLRVSWISNLHRSGSGVPYGTAISAGALFTFPNTPWVTILS